MRRLINNLQSVYTGFGAITLENVYKVIDIPHPNVISKVISACITRDLSLALKELHGKKKKNIFIK